MAEGYHSMTFLFSLSTASSLTILFNLCSATYFEGEREEQWGGVEKKNKRASCKCSPIFPPTISLLAQENSCHLLRLCNHRVVSYPRFNLGKLGLKDDNSSFFAVRRNFKGTSFDKGLWVVWSRLNTRNSSCLHFGGVV